jgi:hypothetical protein
LSVGAGIVLALALVFVFRDRLPDIREALGHLLLAASGR